MWIDLLYDMEFQSSSGANLHNTLKGRPNILFGEISHSHDDFWTATEYVPPGCSGESVVKDFLKWDDLAPIGEITVLWNVKGLKPSAQDFFWCLAAKAKEFGEGCDYEIDEEATVIPITQGHDDV